VQLKILVYWGLFTAIGWGCSAKDETDDSSQQVSCGEGTHLEGDICVVDDTDADADTDAEADADADADGGVDTAGATDTAEDSGMSDPGDSAGADTALGFDTATDSGSVSDTGDSGTVPPPPTDLDLDGFSIEDGDCDDADSAIHPAADEVCDGIDNNCDGSVDEGVLITWYLDYDSDGFGGTAFSMEACDPLTGFVASNDDCDDLDDLSHPGADEICDGADNNCDGTIDEDLMSTFFLDADTDGFGDA
jgi:hypothetical protein